MRRFFSFFLMCALFGGQLFSTFFFQNPGIDFQAIRLLGLASGGASDINECLCTFKTIQENDDDSWFKEWNAIAERLEKEAYLSQEKGHLQSATSAFSRASTYYRTAEFFLHANSQDSRILSSWRKSKECFLLAMKGFSHPITAVKIPFEKTTLPGYLCLVDNSQKKRPLLIIQTGFDGTAEELYFTYAQAAIKRGYSCLIFEGPGQGGVIREQHIPFRPNWETVVTPVVDFALSLPEVNKEKIALLGMSFGGYLVPRALAYEKRIQVGVANGGIFDFHIVVLGNRAVETEKSLESPDGCLAIDGTSQQIMQNNQNFRWSVRNGMFTFHAKSPSDFLNMTRPYSMATIAQLIRAKMLIVDSDQDTQMQGQAQQLYDALQCPKKFMLFTSKECAGLHCQIGAKAFANERIFNWLDENL